MFSLVGAPERSIPHSRVLLGRLPVPRPVQKRPAFYEPEGWLPCSQETATCSGEPEQSSPRNRSTYSTSILIFPPLCLGLPSGLFPSGSPHQNSVCTSPLPAIRVTCPDHLTPLDLITRMTFDEEFKPLNSLCKYAQPPCIVLPLTTKYFPQNPPIENPQLTFSP